jgi:hypothetical protein
MVANSLSPQQLVTDRIVAIVFLCLGVIFEMIWLLPSLMSVMISDSGVTPGKELGIILIILGPIVTVIALAITTIILLALKRRAMIAGIFTLVAPILVVALGAALAFAGT